MWDKLPGFFCKGYWKRWLDLVLGKRFSWEVVTTVKSESAPALRPEGPVVEVSFSTGTKPLALALFTASGFGVAPRK